jgi:hypothetical protein
MEKKVFIKGPDNHQRSRVGANNVMGLFLKAQTAAKWHSVMAHLSARYDK